MATSVITPALVTVHTAVEFDEYVTG